MPWVKEKQLFFFRFPAAPYECVSLTSEMDVCTNNNQIFNHQSCALQNPSRILQLIFTSIHSQYSSKSWTSQCFQFLKRRQSQCLASWVMVHYPGRRSSCSRRVKTDVFQCLEKTPGVQPGTDRKSTEQFCCAIGNLVNAGGAEGGGAGGWRGYVSIQSPLFLN